MNQSLQKIRLKNLYSYSKQSLAPAVSTVGFFLLRQVMFDKSNKSKAQLFLY
jgi:hypothetical protein